MGKCSNGRLRVRRPHHGLPDQDGVHTHLLELLDLPAVVSESGIHHRGQIEELEQVGVDAVLVGEAVMRASDPEAAVRTLTHSEEPTQA